MGNILQDVQDYVVGKLSADYQLSGNCTFLAENRKDIEYEIKNKLGRQGICALVMTPKATYAGKYEDLFLAWQLDELEIDIVENVTVNRGKKDGNYMTGQQVGLRVFDVLCPLSGDYEGQFCPVSLEEGDDNGLLVNKCILKALVYGEHSDTPTPEKPVTYQFVKLLDQPPQEQPHDGWMWREDDGFKICQGTTVYKLGVTSDQMSAYVEQQISSSLSSYYTKSETSSSTEISAALGLKQDKLTDEQIKRIDTPCIPLMISSNVEVSGSNFLDFNCVTRFHNYAVFNGAVDTAQLNLRNDELDTQASLSAFNERTIGIIGGFSNELTASLPVKNGEIAYTSDIAEQVSSLATKSELSAGLSPKADLSAVQSMLSGKLNTSGGTISWLGIGRPEQRIAADVQSLGYVFSIDDYGSATVLPQAGADVKLKFPSEDGTLATQEWVLQQINLLRQELQ